jgi:hypothetical protein
MYLTSADIEKSGVVRFETTEGFVGNIEDSICVATDSPIWSDLVALDSVPSS